MSNTNTINKTPIYQTNLLIRFPAHNLENNSKDSQKVEYILKKSRITQTNTRVP